MQDLGKKFRQPKTKNLVNLGPRNARWRFCRTQFRRAAVHFNHCCNRQQLLRLTTRKLSYRKDDRAMHPIHSCPENFRESLSIRPWLLLQKFLIRFCCNRSYEWMCIQNLKFGALPIPEIIRGTPKIWAVPGYAHAPFSHKFLTGFCSDEPCECTSQIWSP